MPSRDGYCMKIKVGILGATGIVGQQYLKLLENHPWFEIGYLAASEQSSGKTFYEATKNKYRINHIFNSSIEEMIVHKVSLEDHDLNKAKNLCRFVFSALDTHPAKIYEEAYAKHGFAVISNASFFRGFSDIPMLIPEINPHHLSIIETQKRNRGFDKGFIVVKPNCSIQSYLCPLFAIHQKFKIKKVMVTTMQSVSGAGWPGISSMDVLDNIIPFIEGEEDKSEKEPLNILGYVENGVVKNNDQILISASCNRVPVIEGHMACVGLEFNGKKPHLDEVLEIMATFKGLPQELLLPSAPTNPIIIKKENNRPQNKLDKDNGNQMSITVGRLRDCPVMHMRFVGLSHNTIRGAAGGGILNAELLKALDYL